MDKFLTSFDMVHEMCFKATNQEIPLDTLRGPFMIRWFSQTTLADSGNYEASRVAINTSWSWLAFLQEPRNQVKQLKHFCEGSFNFHILSICKPKSKTGNSTPFPQTGQAKLQEAQMVRPNTMAWNSTVTFVDVDIVDMVGSHFSSQHMGQLIQS